MGADGEGVMTSVLEGPLSRESALICADIALRNLKRRYRALLCSRKGIHEWCVSYNHGTGSQPNGSFCPHCNARESK